MNTIKIFCLDDELIELIKLKQFFETAYLDYSFHYTGFEEIEAFKKEFQKNQPDVCLLDFDLRNNEENGLDVLKWIRQTGSQVCVFVTSNYLDSSLISKVILSGASDVLTKNMDGVDFCYRILNSVHNKNTSEPKSEREKKRKNWSGSTLAKVETTLKKILPSAVKTILVRGESGTGKELVAQILKDSLSADTPFVSINAGALPDQIMESELFGYEKGAFTGAYSQKKGLFESAHLGWIFLDEVARLSLTCQAALLRVIESGEVRRMGATQPIHVNVRILSATNEDLQKLVYQGEFREDLLQRLRGYDIVLPPLRERPQEIPMIVDALLERLNSLSPQKSASHSTSKKSVVTKQNHLIPCYRMDETVKTLLKNYTWKRGNIRELWQVILGSSVHAIDGLITPGCLPSHFFEQLESEFSLDKDRDHTLSWILSRHFDPKFPIEIKEIDNILFIWICEKILFQQRGKSQDALAIVGLAEQMGLSEWEFTSRLDQARSLFAERSPLVFKKLCQLIKNSPLNKAP